PNPVTCPLFPVTYIKRRIHWRLQGTNTCAIRDAILLLRTLLLYPTRNAAHLGLLTVASWPRLASDPLCVDCRLCKLRKGFQAPNDPHVNAVGCGQSSTRKLNLSHHSTGNGSDHAPIYWFAGSPHDSAVCEDQYTQPVAPRMAPGRQILVTATHGCRQIQ